MYKISVFFLLVKKEWDKSDLEMLITLQVKL